MSAKAPTSPPPGTFKPQPSPAPSTKLPFRLPDVGRVYPLDRLRITTNGQKFRLEVRHWGHWTELRVCESLEEARHYRDKVYSERAPEPKHTWTVVE